jgi:aspartyl protease family protein
MSGDDNVRLIAGLLMLVLVASSLFGRQLKLGQTLRMALGWAAIFAVVYVLFLYRDEGRAIWNRITTDVSGTSGRVDGATLRVPMREDGHFWVRGRVNGREVEFLVDSGATTTALSEDFARAANVPLDGGRKTVNTANGDVEVTRARIARLEVGPITVENERAVVGASFGDTNVLGMSFLSSLKRWRVEGKTLILEP